MKNPYLSMILVLLAGLTCSSSFLIQSYPRGLTRLNYNGDDNNKNQLRGIDYKLDRYKKHMLSLLKQKKEIIKNITDIDLTISEEDYFQQMMDNMMDTSQEITIRFENVEDESEEDSKDTKSENFEVFRNTGLTFKNVGGYDLIKDELLQCADMLVNYEKYTKYNVRIPKGLILEGPPGNGKTLLAKCFSGEIKVAFIPVSGAQFQEKYVGVGAARVRELFDLATKNVPCIIFIDELDALCRKRSEDGTSRSEHDSTLNELLVNMDGFKSKAGIFIIGATNRVDLLDAAMTRPGRIDKKIFVGNPDVKTRKAILRIHMKGKPMDKSITMDEMLQMSQGYSGAQIENFLNEAMLHALRDNRKEMTRHDLETMSTRTLTGFQAVETKVTPEELYQIAIHEMGHAYASILSGHKKVIKVNIHLWSPKSLGFTLFETQDSVMMTKDSLMGELIVLLGGRVAEEIFFGDKFSSGSAHDIEQAKKIAEQMVVNWGMGDRIIYPSGSEYYKKLLEQEIDTLLQNAFQTTKELLLNNQQLVQEMAKQLVKIREIKYDELLK
jgi:cell division protease FtsH